MIPDAAVEAGRDALWNDGDNLARWCGICSGEMCDDCITIRDDAARAALTAALPLLEAEWRERVAQEIEAGVENNDDPPYAWGMDNAARIVRGGS